MESKKALNSEELTPFYAKNNWQTIVENIRNSVMENEKLFKNVLDMQNNII
jgi:hypothetical protein